MGDSKLETNIANENIYKKFYKVYLAILLSFMTSRLLFQTDILMVSPLGAIATAAFAVPGKIMIIDTIVAMGLGPVISVSVSREKDLINKNKIITSALGFTFFISILLMIIGFIIYPFLNNIFIVNNEIRDLSKSAIFWMTLSIPIRMLNFVSSMCLFASGKSKSVSYIYFFTLSLNLFLNWLFIYKFKYGFSGSYIATFIVSLFELTWLMFLTKKLTNQFPISKFDLIWLKSIFQKLGYEWLRLVSWQFEGFVLIILFASKKEWFSSFSAYGVISEFLSFLLMPIIALMRTSSMQIAEFCPNKNLQSAKLFLKPILIKTLPITILIGIILIFSSKYIGITLYKLDSERLDWWFSFTLIFSIALPIYTFSYLQRACFQACDRFSEIAKIEILMTWFFLIPFCYLALLKQSSILFFLVLFSKELILAVILYLSVNYVRNIYKNILKN